MFFYQKILLKSEDFDNVLRPGGWAVLLKRLFLRFSLALKRSLTFTDIRSGPVGCRLFNSLE